MDCKFIVGQEVVYAGITPDGRSGHCFGDKSGRPYESPFEVGQVYKIAMFEEFRGKIFVIFEGLPGKLCNPLFLRPVLKPKITAENICRLKAPEVEKQEFHRRKPHHKHSVEAYNYSRLRLYGQMRFTETKLEQPEILWITRDEADILPDITEDTLRRRSYQWFRMKGWLDQVRERGGNA